MAQCIHEQWLELAVLELHHRVQRIWANVFIHSGHARKHEVPNGFVQHFIRVVAPGVSYFTSRDKMDLLQ